MNRRKFIISSAIGLAFASGLMAFEALITSFDKVILRVLEHDLKGMNIKKSDMISYSKHASQLNPFAFSSEKRKMIAMYSRLEMLGIKTGPYYEKYRQYRSEIVGNFLLSTNLFWNKLNINDDLNYLGRVFTPYNFPCGNPFSDRYYS